MKWVASDMIAFMMRLRSRAHFIIQRHPGKTGDAILGSAARRRVDARVRLGIVIAVFAAIYVVVAARLVQYGLAEPVATAWINTGANAVASRPDIVDRNGMLRRPISTWCRFMRIRAGWLIPMRWWRS